MIVSAEGELDAYAAPELEALLEAANGKRLVVDLGRASFLDSTALGIVVKAVREVSERGGEARVVLPSGTARRIFELTTLDRVLPIAPNRAEAVSALGNEDAGER